MSSPFAEHHLQASVTRIPSSSCLPSFTLGLLLCRSLLSFVHDRLARFRWPPPPPLGAGVEVRCQFPNRLYSNPDVPLPRRWALASRWGADEPLGWQLPDVFTTSERSPLAILLFFTSNDSMVDRSHQCITTFCFEQRITMLHYSFFYCCIIPTPWVQFKCLFTHAFLPKTFVLVSPSNHRLRNIEECLVWCQNLALSVSAILYIVWLADALGILT